MQAGDRKVLSSRSGPGAKSVSCSRNSFLFCATNVTTLICLEGGKHLSIREQKPNKHVRQVCTPLSLRSSFKARSGTSSFSRVTTTVPLLTVQVMDGNDPRQSFPAALEARQEQGRDKSDLDATSLPRILALPVM